MVLQTVLYTLTMLLLGAHFLRQGSLLLVLISLAAPFLLLHKKRWVLIVLQCIAYVAALLWILFARALVHERMMEGRPYRRLVIILGAVALVSIIAGLLLNTRAMKEKFPAQ
jgi:ABC-type transport system involved in cytochrome c biogenesis permease subunit